MRGIAVAIPLCIVQTAFLSMHTGTLSPIGAHDVGLNLALSHCVYGKDRLEDGDVLGRITTTACLYAAIADYASDAWTLPLAPIAGYLHYEYKDSKPTIARVKPFVVGGCWSAATYLQPLLLRHDPTVWSDPSRLVSLTIAMAAVSHVADIPDAKEDARDGIITPAVSLGEEDATKAAVAAFVVASLLHQGVSDYNVYDYVYDAVLFAAAFALPCGRTLKAGLTVVALTALKARLDVEFSMDLMSSVLLLSEPVHSTAVSAVPWIVEHSRSLPDPMREKLIESTLDLMPVGDRIGGSILRLYTDVARAVYLKK